MTRDMMMFIAGALVTFAFWYAVGPSQAASDGWMYGWEVKIGHRVICRDPYIWHGVREIECER